MSHAKIGETKLGIWKCADLGRPLRGGVKLSAGNEDFRAFLQSLRYQLIEGDNAVQDCNRLWHL